MRTLHAILPAAVFGCLLTAPVALAAGSSEDKPLDPKAFSDTATDTTAKSASSGGSSAASDAGAERAIRWPKH